MLGELDIRGRHVAHGRGSGSRHNWEDSSGSILKLEIGSDITRELVLNLISLLVQPAFSSGRPVWSHLCWQHIFLTSGLGFSVIWFLIFSNPS